MAIQSTAVWEARALGLSSNGAGWDPGIAGAGIDYSQQNAAEKAWDGIASTLGTPGAGSTTLTNNGVVRFNAALVGNAIYINGGANFDIGYYFIVGYTNTMTVTLDRSPSAAGAGSNGSGRCGGATVDEGIQQVTNAMFAGNTFWISGFHTMSAGWTILESAGVKGFPMKFRGYTSTRGDGIDSSAGVIDADAAAVAPLILGTSIFDYSYCYFEFLTWQNNTGAASGVETNSRQNSFFRCKINNVSQHGWQIDGQANYFTECEAVDFGRAGGAVAGFFAQTATTVLNRCVARISPGTSALSTYGFHLEGGSHAFDCIAARCFRGFRLWTAHPLYMIKMDRCIAYGCSGSGIYLVIDGDCTTLINNCMLIDNGGYGIEDASSAAGNVFLRKVAFYNNTSGPIDTGGNFEFHWMGNEADNNIMLLENPFVDGANDDFRLKGNILGSNGEDILHGDSASVFPFSNLSGDRHNWASLGPVQYPTHPRRT